MKHQEINVTLVFYSASPAYSSRSFLIQNRAQKDKLTCDSSEKFGHKAKSEKEEAEKTGQLYARNKNYRN